MPRWCLCPVVYGSLSIQNLILETTTNDGDGTERHNNQIEVMAAAGGNNSHRRSIPMELRGWTYLFSASCCVGAPLYFIVPPSSTYTGRCENYVKNGKRAFATCARQSAPGGFKRRSDPTIGCRDIDFYLHQPGGKITFVPEDFWSSAETPQHQHTIASHISSLPSPKTAHDPASKPTATTTFGQNSITNSTTPPQTSFTSSQAYFPLKHLTPSSPSAAAYHKIDYHPGSLTRPSNANFASLYLTKLINPSAHVVDTTTHSVIISSNVDELTKSEPTILYVMALPTPLAPSSPPLDISSHPPLSILNHNSTYLPTHMHDHLTSPSTQIHHPHPSSIMPAHTLPLALMSQSPVHHHALPLILPLPMSQQY